MRRIIIGMSGASGAIYGIRLLQVLKQVEDVETHLVMSRFARLNTEIETPYTPQQVEELADVVHGFGNQAASISSGSFKTEGMIVAPCSMNSLSGIVHSAAASLLVRAADVVLKEQRRLVLMPREVPLHVGHCKLLYEAARLGAIIAPPMPAFYSHPETIDDLINHSIGRVLDLFDIEASLINRWEGIDRDPATTVKQASPAPPKIQNNANHQHLTRTPK